MQDPSTKGSLPSYWAFISYSSKDRAIARWLHKRIENYRIPQELQSVRFEDGTVLGKHLRPVFRDRDELSGAAELGQAISRALARSRFLIVLCSRDSARSAWVNKEILEFQAAGKTAKILALILNGEPNATSNPSVPDDQECFPPALRYPAEPLAGDLRRTGDGPDRGFLKVLAGMAQLDFDELYRRHERAQRQRRFVLTLVSLAVMVSLAGLAGLALMQRNRAENERARAVRNEQEAARQRDLARAHLARFYQEKAQEPGIGGGKALAWALKAAECDPALLESRAFQGRIAAWAGPFPGPDRCDPTGVRRSGNSWSDFGHHVSRMHKRLVIRNTNSSWRLLAWDGAKTLASGLTEGGIRHVISPPDASWFAFVTYKEADIRSWEDGKRLALIGFRDKGSLASANACGSKLLVAFHRESEKTNETRILAWDPLDPENPAWLGPAIPGELLSFAGVDDEKSMRLIGVTRRDDGLQRVLRSRVTPDGDWEDAPEPTGASRPRFLSSEYQIHQPPGVVMLRREVPPHEVHDLQNGKVYPLSLEESEELVGLQRHGDVLWALVKTGEALSLLDLASGNRSFLFGAVPVDRSAAGPKCGLIAAWDSKANALRIREPDGRESSRSVRLPLGFSLVPSRIHVVSPRYILVEGWASPGDVQILVLVDRAADSEKGDYCLRVPGFQDYLEITTDDDGGVFLKVLSHDLGAISTAANTPSIHELNQSIGVRTHSSEGKPLHLEVNDEGRVRILLTRENDGADELRWMEPGSDAPWIPSPNRLGLSPDLVVRNGCVHLSDYGSSLVIDSSGKALWRVNDPAAGRFSAISLGSRLFILRQDHAGISLIDPESGKPVWSHPMNDTINAVRISEDGDRLLLATSTGMITDSRPRISLKELRPADGFELANLSLELERLEPYGTNFEILQTSPPLLLVDQQSQGGSHECTIYQPENGELVQRLRWIRPNLIPSAVLENRGAVVDCSDAAAGRPQAAWLDTRSGIIRTVPIPLPETLQSIHPDPTGRRILLAMESSMMLWDPDTLAPVRGLLSLGKEFGLGEVRPNHLYLPLWSKDGEFLYLTYGQNIHRLDANTGELINSFSAHRPDDVGDGNRPDILRAAISPNGTRLASVDESGNIKVGITVGRTMDLETLRDFSQRAGGWHTDSHGDLVPWSP